MTLSPLNRIRPISLFLVLDNERRLLLKQMEIQKIQFGCESPRDLVSVISLSFVTVYWHFSAGLGPAGDTGCSLNTGVMPSTKAAIFYENADLSVDPTTESDIDPSRFLFPTNCGNQPLDITIPQPAIAVADPDVTLSFLVTGGQNSSGDFVWWMNNQTFFADWNDPIL